MTTIELQEQKWTQLPLDAGQKYACQYRGAGKCFFRIGAESSVLPLRDGFEMRDGDVIRLSVDEDCFAFSTTNASIVAQEIV